MNHRDPDTAERFRAWIAGRLGLHFGDDRLEYLTAGASRHALRCGAGVPDYLERLQRGALPEDVMLLAAELTVPETYFFRHMDQLRAFVDLVVAHARRRSEPAPDFHVLCVGCASGEEPYSLAMLVREELPESVLGLRIRAIDINVDMLNKAHQGIYTPWALRETPPHLQRHWFERRGETYTLDPRIRAAVSFERINLAEVETPFWQTARYDVVFCRNVLMYFTRDCARRIVARISDALVPDGHLFLGHADTLHGLSEDYHLRSRHGAFYYQRRRPAARPNKEVAAATTPPAARAAQPRIQPIGETAPGPPSRSSAGPQAPERSHAPTLAGVRSLFSQERFRAALEMLHDLPAAQQNQCSAALLRAAVLTQLGDAIGAEATCHAVLALNDGGSATAHHILALCRDQARDVDGAITHACQAAQLDPAFAMPRLHLGLMANRNGRKKAACRDLKAALTLLEDESDEHVLLFGGGFGRGGLIALCRSELRAAGGDP